MIQKKLHFVVMLVVVGISSLALADDMRVRDLPIPEGATNITYVKKRGDVRFQVESDFKSFESALAMYKLNAGSFPTTQQGLKALQDKPSSTPVPRRWVQVMSKLPPDPWGAEYGYRFPGKKRANDFEMFSKGPDGQEGTPDDLSSQDD